MIKRWMKNRLVNWIRKKNLDLLLFQERVEAIGGRHVLSSAVFSTDDEVGQPNGYLLDIALEAAKRCKTIALDEPKERFGATPHPYYNRWPGEHYRLLAALCEVLNANNVVEIGTFTGLGALALMHSMPMDGTVVTFDIMKWNNIPGTFLRDSDFASGRLRQIVADLSQLAVAQSNAAILREAQLIFIDAAKDGFQERLFLDNFKAIGIRKGTLLIFDDTRTLNMLKIWREIRLPKLDLTSFGHFTGTGLVLWE